MSDITLQVIRDEQGKLKGFSLLAQSHTQSEIFCHTFPQAIRNGAAEICIDKDEIVFIHSACKELPEFSSRLTDKDLADLEKLIEEKSQFTINQTTGKITSGFQIIFKR